MEKEEPQAQTAESIAWKYGERSNDLSCKGTSCTDDEIEAVYLQLTDFEGEASNYISLYPISSKPNEKMYDVSLGGFVEEYAGTQWSYRIIVQESSGIQYNFVDVPFIVAGTEQIQSFPPTATPQLVSATPMDTGTVLDADWPHGGAIQSSVGRILFDFGGETHVCSGTVINDGGIYNERSLILTAAHCAYDVRSYDLVSSLTIVNSLIKVLSTPQPLGRHKAVCFKRNLHSRSREQSCPDRF